MKANHLPNKSGFKSPKNDLDTLEERLSTQLFLEDKKSAGFKLPDNYLSNFTVHIETPKQKKVKVRSLFNKKLILAVSSVAATLALLLTLTFNKKPVTFNSIENDTLSNYILDETTANDLALLLEDDTYQEADFLSLDNEILDTIVNDLDLEDLIQN